MCVAYSLKRCTTHLTAAKAMLAVAGLGFAGFLPVPTENGVRFLADVVAEEFDPMSRYCLTIPQ